MKGQLEHWSASFGEVDTTTGVHTGIMVALVPVHPSHLATHLEVHEDTVVVSLHPHTGREKGVDRASNGGQPDRTIYSWEKR